MYDTTNEMHSWNRASQLQTRAYSAPAVDYQDVIYYMAPVGKPRFVRVPSMSLLSLA
jgi:hypothetical protein